MKYLKLSQTKETEAKRLKVEVEDLVMADLKTHLKLPSIRKS